MCKSEKEYVHYLLNMLNNPAKFQLNWIRTIMNKPLVSLYFETWESLQALEHILGPPTEQPGPGSLLGSAQAGHRLMHLHLLSLDLTWIRSFTSLSLQTRHLSAIFQEESSVLQTVDDVQMMQMMVSHAQPYSRAEPSWAGFHSRDSQVYMHFLVLKPSIFASVNSPKSLVQSCYNS